VGTVIEFDLEGAIEDKLFPDVGVAFESIIRLAKEYPLDAALWEIRDGFQAEAAEEAVRSAFQKYVPVPDGVKKYVLSRFTFRVKDKRKEKA
jgi:hypothetical protein